MSDSLQNIMGNIYMCISTPVNFECTRVKTVCAHVGKRLITCLTYMQEVNTDAAASWVKKV